MAKATYIFKGETIDYVNPSTTKSIEAGDIVNLTTRIGVAATDIPASGLGALNVVGVYALPKSNIAISIGDAVYYSASSNAVTKTNTDIPCGFAVAAATASDATVQVKIG
jgi:predicted RecA/RadA family phage recombinase